MKKVGFLVVGSFLVGSWAVGQFFSGQLAVGQFFSGQLAVGQFFSRQGAVGQGAGGQEAVGSRQWGELDTGRVQKHLHTLPTFCRDFTTDKLQNVYVVDENNRVHKYGPDGREQFHFNNNTRGALTYIDPTDPFNLLLFYPELQVVATLDRTMNETAVLELFTAGIFNATAIGLATDNNIWVYDQAAFRLKKVGQNGEVLVQSDNLSALLDAPPKATQLLANNNIVYLNCPGQGIYVFDNFGQFHQLLPYPDVFSLQIQDGKLLLYSGHRVRAYNPETLQEQLLRGDIQADVQVRYQGNRVYEKGTEGLVRVFSRTP